MMCIRDALDLFQLIPLADNYLLLIAKTNNITNNFTFFVLSKDVLNV